MSLLEQQLQRGRCHALLPQWRGLVAKALRDIGTMLARHPRSYVALSWGKQSIVLAHLVWRVDRGVLAVHWTGPDAELIGNFSEVRDQFLSRFPLPYEQCWHAYHLRSAIHEWEASRDYTGVFIGLCAYESKGRRHAIAAAGRNGARETHTTVRCWPLGWWAQDDLAAYIAVHNLPMLTPYHRYGLAVRTSTGAWPGHYTERAVDLMNSGNAAKLRRRWREVHEP